MNMEKFMGSMDVLFKQYKKDGVIDSYHRDGHFFTVGKKDSAYLWAALDGAVHLWNSLHEEEDALCLDSYRSTGVTDTYIIQYVVDVDPDEEERLVREFRDRWEDLHI